MWAGVTDAPVTLAQPEDAHTQAEWEAATAAVLRKAGRLTESDPDAAVWAKLTRKTLDDIEITPLGLPGRAVTGLRPSRAGAWDIRAIVADPDAKAANENALVDLDGGVTSLWVHADEGTDLDATLKGVLLDLAPVVLDAPTATVSTAKAFLNLAVDFHEDTNLGGDPLGAMLRDLPVAVDEAVDELKELAELATKHNIRAIVVDATAAHDLGASDAQELGWSIAVGVAYLRWLTDHGLSVEDAAKLIEFRYAATDEQFPTIAKLRAARQLWARALEISGVTAASGAGCEQRQHAVTSRPMLSKYDPYVNMLRGTVAAFAAGAGGADAVTVLPFDSANGRPDGFGRRIARNVNHLLIDESHVAVVTDPAGGSYAVEQLTADTAAAGWAEFVRIESEWENGEDFTPFKARIDAVVAKREAEIAKRKRPITGVSEFPNLGEVLPARADDPLNDRVRRYGASFEALRDKPSAKNAFLATLGTVAQHTARATFASNLLAAGGIGVDVAGASTGADDLAARYDGQPVVVLAGSDAAYAEWGQAAADALRAKGASWIVIAGKPADYADDSAAMGVDALAFLNTTRAHLGASHEGSELA